MSFADSADQVAYKAIERVVPGEAPEGIFAEHMSRYHFASSFVKNKVVLDVACGSGYAAPVLCKAGARSYLGVDVSPEAVGIAEQRYHVSETVRFLCDDACRLPIIEESSFDVAISFETVEHLDDPRRFLSNLARVLKPDGLLLISTPNRSLFNPGGSLASKPKNPFHVREWNKREFIELLGDFFDIKGVFGQIQIPRWKAVVLRGAALNNWVGASLAMCLTAKRHVVNFSGKGAGPNSSQASHDVRPLNSWWEPTFLVCVAAPRKPTAPITAR